MCLMCNAIRSFQSLSVFLSFIIIIYLFIIWFPLSSVFCDWSRYSGGWAGINWLIPALVAICKRKKKKNKQNTISNNISCHLVFFIKRAADKQEQSAASRIQSLQSMNSFKGRELAFFLYEWDNQRVFSRQTALLRRKVCEEKKKKRRKAPVITLSAVIFYGDVRRL